MRAAAIEQVRLTAQKGRDLQDVDDLGDRRTLTDFVHIRDDRQAELFADFSEHRQRTFEPYAALAGKRGAVGLVEGRLVDETEPQTPGDLLQRRGRFQRVRTAFHLAWAGEHRDRRIVGESDGPDRHARIGL